MAKKGKDRRKCPKQLQHYVFLSLIITLVQSKLLIHISFARSLKYMILLFFHRCNRARKQIHPSKINTGEESNKIIECNYCTEISQPMLKTKPFSLKTVQSDCFSFWKASELPWTHSEHHWHHQWLLDILKNTNKKCVNTTGIWNRKQRSDIIQTQENTHSLPKRIQPWDLTNMQIQLSQVPPVIINKSALFYIH